MLNISKKFVTSLIKPSQFPVRNFGQSSFAAAGFDDFYDKTDEVMTAGRAWTATDLRKKVIPFSVSASISIAYLMLYAFRVSMIYMLCGGSFTKREISCLLLDMRTDKDLSPCPP